MAINFFKPIFSRVLCKEFGVTAILCAILVLILPEPPGDRSQAFAQTQDLEPVQVVLQKMLGQVTILQHHMGVSKTKDLDIRIRNVSLHDLYFQTQSVFAKTNRFSFEILRLEEKPPQALENAEKTQDILGLIQAAASTLQRVITELKLSDAAPISNALPEANLDATYNAMLGLSRQLNGLLEHPYSPSDVFGQVTYAVGYAARLLAAYPQAQRIPDDPPFEPGKQPVDVYLQLNKCMGLISSLYTVVGLPTLVIERGDIDSQSIYPGDVYDLASLVVARLDNLHHQLGRTAIPRAILFPGRRFPSDVFQRAGLLEKQLLTLKELMDQYGPPSR